MTHYISPTYMFLSMYLLHKAESWVEFKKLGDVVVDYIFWDCCVVKELQVGLVHHEQLNLQK